MGLLQPPILLFVGYLAPKGLGAQPAICHPLQLKNGIFRNQFSLDILTIHNYQISYVKHVFMCFSPYLVVWRGQGVGGTTWLRSFPLATTQNGITSKRGC